MFNLLVKEFKLGVNPMFLVLPLLTGALFLIPGWLYFIALLYFCFITVPNLYGIYKSQNDLIFSTMLPVAKKDIVRAKLMVIVLLEILHVVVGAVFGVINYAIYPNLKFFFFGPTIGFWGLCLIMFALFNVVFFPMFFKTAYKFGAPTIIATAVAMLFATAAEWIGIANPYIKDLFKGAGISNITAHMLILISCIALFAILNIIAYNIAVKLFEKVDV